MTSRLRHLVRPRLSRAQLVVALLCGLVGFALAIQVRANGTDTSRRAARPEELARILDDLGTRSDRLRTEIDELRVTRDRLASGTDRSRAALTETRRRAEELGILAGTLPASGTGVVLTVSDPRGNVRATVLLNAVQELRDAGAEALQVSGGPGSGAAVRIVAVTAFQDDPAGGVVVGPRRLAPPYRLIAIGDPATLAPALRIPGGVVDAVAAVPGAAAGIVTSSRAAVTALHRLSPPRYARPATSPPAG